jgi:hypothetical protein
MILRDDKATRGSIEMTLWGGDWIGLGCERILYETCPAGPAFVLSWGVQELQPLLRAFLPPIETAGMSPAENLGQHQDHGFTVRAIVNHPADFVTAGHFHHRHRFQPSAKEMLTCLVVKPHRIYCKFTQYIETGWKTNGPRGS